MKFIKSLFITFLSLICGFIAISLPFGLFRNLTADAIHIVFMAEIIIYFSIGLIFLLIIDKRKQQKIKSEMRHTKRCEKIRRVHEEWINIAA